jgi:hypothetical protein
MIYCLGGKYIYIGAAPRDPRERGCAKGSGTGKLMSHPKISISRCEPFSQNILKISK